MKLLDRQRCEREQALAKPMVDALGGHRAMRSHSNGSHAAIGATRLGKVRCYNDCAGRGTCMEPGICACVAPWRGYDCSEPIDEGFVYIYSPPAELGLTLMRKAVLKATDPLYSAEHHFFNQLMSDFSMRTLAPERVRTSSYAQRAAARMRA